MNVGLPILTGVLGAILGAFLGLFLGAYTKRPKLVVNGSGSGGRRNHISIQNQPGMLGFNIKPTMILGKRIHRGLQKGISIDRAPARECRAWMIDKLTGENIGGLWWRSQTNPDRMQQTVTIESGETFSLMLFARTEDSSAYFAYQPQGETNHDPVLPSVTFQDTRTFIVRVSYSYGRQRFDTEMTMQRKLDGRLEWRSKTGGGSF
jgi:hypothetical protein